MYDTFKNTSRMKINFKDNFNEFIISYNKLVNLKYQFVFYSIIEAFEIFQ